MKRSFFCKILSVILALATGFCCCVFNEPVSVSAYDIPDSIRVGLKVIEAAYAISSASGMTYGYTINNAYTALETVAANEIIYIRQDAYFYNGTNLPTKYTSASSVPSGKNTYGPYRVQIGEAYASYEEVKVAANTLSTELAQHCYPAYNGTAWMVYTGDYTSEEKAVAGKDTLLKKNESLTCKIVKQNNTALVLQDKAYKTLLFFCPGKNMKFTVKPLEATLPLLKLGTQQFRGYLEFRRFSDRDITVINILGFDEYLYGVLPTEVSAGWNLPEVFKAQAVSARNFAFINYRSAKHPEYDFDVCSTSNCQNYGGYSAEYKVTNEAVDATSGQLLLYDGKPASIYYSASDGGYTEGTENVWSAVTPYYKAVKDPYDPKQYLLYSMTAAEASATLKAKGYNVGNLQSIAIKKRSSSGRALEMVVTGTAGSATIKKNQTRGAFGLRSQLFSIRTDSVYTMLEGEWNNALVESLDGTKYSEAFIKASTFTLRVAPADGIMAHNDYYYETVTIKNQSDMIYFDVYGNGHGIGMSQLGAKAMAQQGLTYIDIMNFYYPGTTVG